MAQGWSRRSHGVVRLTGALAMLGVGLAAAVPCRGQQPAEAPGEAVVAPPAETVLPPDVQIVRLQGPAGVKVEVLGPDPVPVPQGDGHGWATLGLRLGVSYQLRLSNLPYGEGAELYPVIQLIGHLHRPPGIDPARYPIRIQLSEADFENVLRGGRLVTYVVYLENPEVAVPMHLPKDDVPPVTLSPVEDPVKVAAALGRPMAIVQVGNRKPTQEDLSGAAVYPLANVPCPFSMPLTGERCPLACGPVSGTAPPADRSWMPRDEFLCDGGDFGRAAAFAGNGGLAGIDPRDAVVRFQTERSARPRVLPTNLVCIYAPRFGAVRRPYGANENTTVIILAGHERVQGPETGVTRQYSRRLTQNLAPQGLRERERPGALATRDNLGSFTELRVLSEADTIEHIRGHNQVQGPDASRNRTRAQGIKTPVPPHLARTAESAVITGIVQGANEQVMAWKPQEAVGVEEPPNKPGLAVIKQVDTDQAEPGDVVTYQIRFRNMGNVPIRAVSIVDNLLPRLEYVKGSAQGPKGSVFTARDNIAGSSELRWDLPGAIAPGAEGSVSFRVRVR